MLRHTRPSSLNRVLNQSNRWQATEAAIESRGPATLPSPTMPSGGNPHMPKLNLGAQ